MGCPAQEQGSGRIGQKQEGLARNRACACGWQGAVGRGEGVEPRLCRFTLFCGLSVIAAMCALWHQHREATQALRQRQECSPRPQPRAVPVRATRALWPPQCWGPSLVSSKQVGPRTWSHTPAGGIAVPGGKPRGSPASQGDPHCLLGIHWEVCVPGNPGGSASCNW